MFIKNSRRFFRVDGYKNVHVKSLEKLPSILKEVPDATAIWVYLPVAEAGLLPGLLSDGYEIHHAK
jgi:hypothetical protein